MALSAEQQRVRNAIVRIGRQRGASVKEIKAALETGIVESNLRNLPGGDADSAGWRQERASLYRDPTNLTASINRFFDETAAVRGRYGSAGALAAAVQRPAAQYRGRYQQVAGQAEALMGGRTGGVTPTAGSRETVTTTIPGVDNRAARAALISSFLEDRNADPVSFAVQARALRDIPEQTRSQTIAVPGVAGRLASGGSSLAQIATQRADVIDAQRLPYVYGGGHSGKTALHDAVPLDCSAAVSKVLGIDPRVSGDFQRWGRPGDGGNTGVTIAANPDHVLMKINGHWFGTSASNPGGGAGWIPESQITPEYLKGFTLRHSAR